MKIALTAGVTAIGVVLTGGTAWADGTMTGATAHGSSSVYVADAAFDGPDCLDVPFDVTYVKTPTTAEDIWLGVKVSASQAGSNRESTGRASSSFLEPAAATVRDEIRVCPYYFESDQGPVTVRGTLETTYWVNGSEQTAELQPPVVMNLVRNQSAMSKIRVQKGSKYDSSSKKISGRIVASTITKGLIGADGKVSIAVKKPGKKKWVGGATTYMDEFGNWDTTVRGVPKGSKIRVTLTDCDWCTDVSKTVKVRR